MNLEYSMLMNINNYNPLRKQKKLIVFDCMISDINAK